MSSRSTIVTTRDICYLKDMSPVMLYLTFIIGGVLLEEIFAKLYYHFTKKKLRTNHFFFGRYLFLLIFPLLGTILIINLHGWSLFKIFITFLILGPILEWLVGFTYYQIVGARLWTYRQFSYKGHISLLVAPLWGMAGVLFYLISKKLT